MCNAHVLDVTRHTIIVTRKLNKQEQCKIMNENSWQYKCRCTIVNVVQFWDSSSQKLTYKWCSHNYLHQSWFITLIFVCDIDMEQIRSMPVFISRCSMQTRNNMQMRSYCLQTIFNITRIFLSLIYFFLNPMLI